MYFQHRAMYSFTIVQFFPINLHSSRTYIFNKCMNTTFDTYWYFWPHNECISRCTQKFLATHNSTRWNSGHGFFQILIIENSCIFAEPYGIRGFHDNFTFQNFSPVGDLSPAEKEYLLSSEKWGQEYRTLCPPTGSAAHCAALVRCFVPPSIRDCSALPY